MPSNEVIFWVFSDFKTEYLGPSLVTVSVPYGIFLLLVVKCRSVNIENDADFI